jgi:hypothetical protein
MMRARTIRLVGHVARSEEMKGRYKILVRKHEGNRSFGRAGLMWTIIIKRILRKQELGSGVDSCDPVQDTVK